MVGKSDGQAKDGGERMLMCEQAKRETMRMRCVGEGRRIRRYHKSGSG